MWNSREDFDAFLRDAYQEFGLSSDDLKSQAIGSVLWDLRDQTKITVPTSTEIGLSILDALISDAILWNNLFYAHLIAFSKNAETKSAFLQSMWALFAKITQDTIIVRDLINAGYDVQARNALRSLEEHIDFAIYLCLHPDVGSEFVETQDEEAANKFWYKHIRKVSDNVARDLSSRLGEGLSQIAAFRREERKVLSAAHHPSYWACTMLLLSPSEPDNVLNNIFGVRSEFSFRTGKLLFFSLSFLIILLRRINEQVDAFISSIPGDNQFEVFLKSGEAYFRKTLRSLVENWDAPVFGESQEFRLFADSLQD